MIEIRYMSILKANLLSLNNFLPKLPNTLQLHIKEKKREKDKIRSLLGLFLVASFLEENHLPFTLLSEIRYNNFKKPCFRTINLDFNISHTDEYVSSVFSFNHKVGIDIERVRTVKGWRNCSYFNFQDKKNIIEATIPSKEFLKIWCKKEAVSKGIGKGLNIALKKIIIQNNIAEYNGKTWFLLTYTIKDNFLAVACDNQPAMISLIEM